MLCLASRTFLCARHALIGRVVEWAEKEYTWRMRSRRANLLVLLFIVCVVALATRSKWPASGPRESDRAAVIDAFLRKQGSGAIVEEQMEPVERMLGGPEYTDRQAAQLGVPFDLERLSQTMNVPTCLTAAKQVVTSSDIERLNGNDFWGDFHELYGKNSYLVGFSPIAFSRDGKDAIFVASCFRGIWSGEIGVAHLRLETRGWVVVNFKVILVS